MEKPEDLCFFKEGRLFSGSVSHEHICYVYEQGHDWDEQIKHHGTWEQVPDELNERIQISYLGGQLFMFQGGRKGDRYEMQT